jgi:hypothetical protein
LRALSASYGSAGLLRDGEIRDRPPGMVSAPAPKIPQYAPKGVDVVYQ